MARGSRITDDVRRDCLRTLARTDSLAEVQRRHRVTHSTVLSWLKVQKWQDFLDEARRAVAREIGRENERLAHDAATALRGGIACCTRAIQAMLKSSDTPPPREAAMLTKALAVTYGQLDRILRLDRGEPTERHEHTGLSDSALDREIQIALSDPQVARMVAAAAEKH